MIQPIKERYTIISRNETTFSIVEDKLLNNVV